MCGSTLGVMQTFSPEEPSIKAGQTSTHLSPSSSAKGSGAAGTAASALRISARLRKLELAMVRKTIKSEWCDGKREDELADQISARSTRKSDFIAIQRAP